jgi:hypothetical protein
VALGHLSYGADSSAGLAQKKLLEMAKGGGDSECCHPPENPPLPSPELWAQTLKANGGKPPKPKSGTTIDQWAQAISVSNGGIPQYSQKRAKIKL